MGFDTLTTFRKIWLLDFEFQATSGERPKPHCMVARELRSGESMRIMFDEVSPRSFPFENYQQDLFVAYYATAEIGCFLALGWPVPENVIDLYLEFRNLTNGLTVAHGSSLLGALSYFGLNAMTAAEKSEMHDLAIRGGPYTRDESSALLDYCEEDVVALIPLLEQMLPHINNDHALLRGRYMCAVAEIEHRGTPMDQEALSFLKDSWDSIKIQLITKIDADYGVYVGQTFKEALFREYLVREKISWPTLPSGKLELGDETFREQARLRPKIAPLRELRASLSSLRLSDLAVGSDGRNRTLISPFRSRTGRNQPSNSKFIFGPSTWMRSSIRARSGRAVAYIDYSQQEFGIAAALSGDERMLAAYNSGDPYLAFAKQAGAAPPEATRKSHGAIRDQYKQCVLAVQYGMGEEALAFKIGQPKIVARHLLRTHRETYRTFWQWSDGALDYAMVHGYIQTVFGWRLKANDDTNPRMIRNFPMQANGAEMLRLACILCSERGVEVCAPVHDAILIEASTDEIDEAVESAIKAMGDASEIVLSGFRLSCDSKVFRHPERYYDKRGLKMWNQVWSLIGKPEFFISET